MMGVLVVASRRRLSGLPSSLWLDSAVGSLAAASAIAVVLAPVLDSAATGPLSVATVVSLAYPVSDLLLVATLPA